MEINNKKNIFFIIYLFLPNFIIFVAHFSFKMENYEYPDIETDILLDDVVVESKVYNLVVYNDEVNTFDFVISTLIDVCQHAPEQAEQCTMIIHYKGKCTVKKGDFEELAPMRNAICNRGISAELM